MKKLIILLVLLLVMGQTLWAAETHELKIVKQTYNINADAPDKMYQFEPDYLEINVNDTVKFPGTVGRHTVHSVRDMLPEGAKKISIMPRQPNEVTFTIPGVYGINCKLHQRHGMVAVIVVGGDLHNMEKARQGVKWVSPHSRKKLHGLLDKADANFTQKKFNQK